MRKAASICILLVLLLLLEAKGAGWSWFNSELDRLESEINSTVITAQALPSLPEPQVLERPGFHSAITKNPNTISWVQVDLGREFPLDSIVLIPAFLGTAQRAPKIYGFPSRFRIDASNDPAFLETTTVLDRTDADYEPIMAPIHIPTQRLSARYIRVTATKLYEDPITYGAFFCLGELFAFSGGQNVAVRKSVTASKASETPPIWTLNNLVDGASALGLPVVPDSKHTHGWRSAVSKIADSPKWVQVDLRTKHSIQEIRLIPAHPVDFPERTAFGFPVRFKVEVSDSENFEQPLSIFDNTQSDFPSPGDNPVAFSAPDIVTRYVRVTATRLWERSSDFVFGLAELEVYSAGTNIARGCSVTSLDDVEPGKPMWRREYLTDGYASTGILSDWNEWLQKLSERKLLREHYGSLQKQKTAALAVAQRRASILGISTAIIAVALSALAAWRSRAQQRSSLRELRERIARDLHDDLGSQLGSIRLMSELALRNPAASTNQQTLMEIQRLSAEAAESMHSIVWLMQEKDKPSISRLVEAIRQSADTLLTGLPWELSALPAETNPIASLDFHRHIILFVRESLHNISRHAAANSVSITTAWTSTLFSLDIKDDGCGFDSASHAEGNGLRNLRHRANSLRGKVLIESTPGKGTRIQLKAPIV